MKAILPLLATMAFVGAACSDNNSASPETTSEADASTPSTTVGRDDGRPVGAGGPFVRGLVAFDSCNSLLDHIKAEARDRVGPYGLDHHGGYWPEIAFTAEMTAEMATDESAADFEMAEEPAGNFGSPVSATVPATGGDDSDGGGFTGTNTQEVDVDEPDIIKTDGERIITISEGSMTVVDAASGEVSGSLWLDEGWGHELFFAGNRALVVTNGGQWGMPTEPFGTDAEGEFAEESYYEPDYYRPTATILEIDLSGEPSIVSTMRIEGQYLSARAVGDTVRLALTAGPQELPWLYPGSQSGEERATEANRDVIDDSTLDDWLPSYQLVADGLDETAPLLDCERLHRPAEFAGFDIVTVLDISLTEGLADGVASRDTVGVLAGGQTVYSSTDRFYVATTEWFPQAFANDASVADEWIENYRTDLHAFSISTDAPTEYVASGSLEGSLLNQFSIDEHDGYVRVLTTDGTPWSRTDETETSLTVLEERDGELVQVGHVGGLGKGEQLFSARLLDDIGFAVTFRQIDPFYVLDLRDPTNPMVSGELKIPGFSTYLHPLGDDRVLGIGQDATEEGFQTGFKLSMFDVSNPADPRETSVWTLPDATSPAEYDHRAFQIWGNTAIIPVQSWSDGFNGAILFDLSDGITEIGRISHVENDAVTSDCRLLTTDDVPENSEFFWMAQDQYAQVYICGENAVGTTGGGQYCDVLPIEEAQYYFWDGIDEDGALEALGAQPTDRIEICYNDGDWQRSIQRSLVIGDDLWTLSPMALQANDFSSLEFITQVPVN